MNNILQITLLGLSVGVIGTGMGGFIAFFLKNPGKKFLSIILGFSSGLMLSIVCFDLLPEAFAFGQLYISVLGILMGAFMMIWFDENLPQTKNHHKPWEMGGGFVKTGILLGVGVALHNFPEGLAIGSGMMATRELGLGIAIVIALHNIPEGISMATPMSVGGLSRWKAFFYTLLVGVPMGFGTFIGAMLGEISPIFIAFCLSFAGGTMLYITCGELIPKTQSLHYAKLSSIGFIFGFIGGIVLTSKF